VDWLELHPWISLAMPDNEKKDEKRDQPLKGEVIVFTGFAGEKARQLQQQIIQSGGDCRSDVSGRTTMLVAKDLDKVGRKKNKLPSSARLVLLDDFLDEYGFEL